MKGNTVTPCGIMYSPYKKATIVERIWTKIMRLLRKPKKLKHKWNEIP